MPYFSGFSWSMVERSSTEDSQSVKQSILRLGWSETSSMLILQTTQVSDGCCDNHATDGWAVWLLVLLLANVVGAVVLAGLVWRHWGNLSRAQRLPLAAASVGLAFALVGPIYWSPTYDKLWLQPIAAIVLLVGFALAASAPLSESASNHCGLHDTGFCGGLIELPVGHPEFRPWNAISSRSSNG